MALTITLTPEDEARFRDAAARAGLSPEQLAAQRLLEAELLWHIRTAAIAIIASQMTARLSIRVPVTKFLSLIPVRIRQQGHWQKSSMSERILTIGYIVAAASGNMNSGLHLAEWLSL